MLTRPRLILPLALLLLLAVPAAAWACLPAAGHVSRTAIRGVRVGATAKVPAGAVAASYCVADGGSFSFALDAQAAVLLVVSTAAGDSVRGLSPGGRVDPSDLRRLGSSGGADLYALGGDNQLVLGVRRGRVAFVAAADRLLLGSRGKLNYWLGKLGF